MPRSDSRISRVTFLIPGAIETRTGGYEYDRRIITELRARGWIVDVKDATEPGALGRIERDEVVVVDGLALDSTGRDFGREAARLRLVALIHMPGASGTDERAAMRRARLIVVTGAIARPALAGDGVEPAQIVVVEPGTDVAPVSTGSGDAGPLRLLAVGNVTCAKGHENLVNALRSIDERNWTLTIAGALTRDREAVSRLDLAVRDAGLQSRVALRGELNAGTLATAYDEADVFVLATLQETYGMAVAEAIARGLPVVSTRTGAIPEVVGEGGLIVEPGNVIALAAALSSVLRDTAIRQRLRDGALRARARLRTWQQAGDEFNAILARIAAV